MPSLITAKIIGSRQVNFHTAWFGIWSAVLNWRRRYGFRSTPTSSRGLPSYLSDQRDLIPLAWEWLISTQWRRIRSWPGSKSQKSIIGIWDRYYFFVRNDAASAPNNQTMIPHQWRARPGRIGFNRCRVHIFAMLTFLRYFSLCFAGSYKVNIRTAKIERDIHYLSHLSRRAWPLESKKKKVWEESPAERTSCVGKSFPSAFNIFTFLRWLIVLIRSLFFFFLVAPHPPPSHPKMVKRKLLGTDKVEVKITGSDLSKKHKTASLMKPTSNTASSA